MSCDTTILSYLRANEQELSISLLVKKLFYHLDNEVPNYQQSNGQKNSSDQDLKASKVELRNRIQISIEYADKLSWTNVP
ncbi:unnamed protein product [Schistosoma rodhaini]|nr:unnamed protein product [Schistosoma rodhaini]